MDRHLAVGQDIIPRREDDRVVLRRRAGRLDQGLPQADRPSEEAITSSKVSTRIVVSTALTRTVTVAVAVPPPSEMV